LPQDFSSYQGHFLTARKTNLVLRKKNVGQEKNLGARNKLFSHFIEEFSWHEKKKCE